MKASISLAALLLTSPLARAGDPPPTIQDILSVKRLSDVRIAPGRDRILFVATEPDFEKSHVDTNLYLVVEGAPAVRLTRSGARNDHPRFSPEGGLVAFLSDRGAEPKTQIWVLPPTGEARRLTNAPRGVKTFVFAPDGRSIYYVADEEKPPVVKSHEDERKKLKLDAIAVEKDIPRKQIRRVTVESGKDELVFAGDPGIKQLAMDPEGRRLAFTSNKTGKVNDDKKTEIYVLDLESKGVARLTERGGEEESIAFSVDGRTIFFVAPLDPNITYSKRDLFSVSVSGGDPKDLTRDWKGSVVSARPAGDGRSVIVNAAVRTASILAAVPLAGGTPLPIADDDRVMGDFDVASDGRSIAWVEESAGALPEVRSRLGFDRPPTRLTNLNEALVARSWPRPELFVWNEVDGTTIEGVLVRPIAAKGRVPTVLLVHGGPHGRVAMRLVNHYATLLASEGYAVLMPNYRGSDGYGHEFAIANFKDLGGKDLSDCLTGVDALVAAGVADPERLAIMGGSYGGYMTNWAITQDARFKAAVSLYGIFSLITDYSNSEDPQWETGYLGGFYWTDFDAYWKRSAASAVANVKTPVLILHGQEDTNTFIANSKEMYNALSDLGKSVDFTIYPREGHGFVEPNHRIDEWDRIRRFLRRHLKPGLAPEWGLGETVTLKDGRSVEVREVKLVTAYSGILPSGVFLEATLVLGEDQLEFSRRRFRPAEEVVLTVDGTPLKPAGLVAGGTTPYLVTGADLAIGVAPDGSARSARTVTLAFDVARSGRSFTLEVTGFPAIALSLPEAPSPK